MTSQLVSSDCLGVAKVAAFEEVAVRMENLGWEGLAQKKRFWEMGRLQRDRVD